MKIVSTGRTISTTEYLAKKMKARRQRLYIASGAFFVLVIAAVFILRLESLQITETVAEGVPATGALAVEARAEDVLSGSYLWLVPKTNAFLYPKTKLERTLAREFPRLSSVAVSLEGSHVLKIEGVERKPFATYCSDTCYFLDETGFIFDVSPVFSEGVYFVYRVDPPLEQPLGRELVPQPEFESLAAFVARVGRLDVEPRSLRLSQAEGRLALAGGAVIVFSRGADTETLARSLESFLESEPIKAEKYFWQRVSTLDMRTENKVFYSFR